MQEHPPIVILFVAANPTSSIRKRAFKDFSDFVEEFKSIAENIRSPNYKDRLRLVVSEAVGYSDLISALYQHEPHILHISTQSGNDGSLMLESRSDNPQIIDKEQLLKLLTAKEFKKNLHLVFINAGDSQGLAHSIPPGICLAIGMDTTIPTGNARDAMRVFYQGLAYGKTVEDAFEVAGNSLLGEPPFMYLYPPRDKDPKGNRNLAFVPHLIWPPPPSLPPPSPPEPASPSRPLPQTITVLLVSASPDTQVRIRVDREFNRIIAAMRSSALRDRFNFIQLQAARFKDLRSALLQHKPQVLHISSHGEPDGSLKFEAGEDDDGIVHKPKLHRLLKALRKELCLIIFNACYSEEVTRDIPPMIDLAIGMSDAISDVDAVRFSSAFYEALGYGRTVENAIEFAMLDLDEEVPRLFPVEDKDPNNKRQLVLVAPPPPP